MEMMRGGKGGTHFSTLRAESRLPRTRMRYNDPTRSVQLITLP
jgi:hypothetical protein